jgi:hypothetical protein
LKGLKQGVLAIGGALSQTIEDLTKRITNILVSAMAWVKANKATVVRAHEVAAAYAVAGLSSSDWATSSPASARRGERHRGRRTPRDRLSVQPDRRRH